MNMKHQWQDDISGAIWCYCTQTETCCSAILTTTNPIWTTVGLNLGLYSVKVLTSHLSYAIWLWIYVTTIFRGSWESTVRAVTCRELDRANPGGGKIFRVLQSSSEAHPTSCTMSSGSLPGIKRSGHGADHIPPFCAKDVYGYNDVSALPPSHSVPSWHVVQWPLPFNCTRDNGNDNTTV
jgi:hypothetical protein